MEMKKPYRAGRWARLSGPWFQGEENPQNSGLSSGSNSPWRQKKKGGGWGWGGSEPAISSH